LNWEKTFPLAPPLATFLADVCKTPKPYKLFAPSKNHRPVYLEMLAWLVRGAWVTQLRTFVWVIVWPEIRYEVEYEMDRAMLKRASEEALRDQRVEQARVDDATSGATASAEQLAERARLARSRQKAQKEWAEFQRRPRPVATATPSVNAVAPLHILRVHTSLIVDPARPSREESLYLEAISKRFANLHTRQMFLKFAKYFNGREAMEMVALKEGMKRREVMGLLVEFDEHLVCARHW
jgi:hypothetical protein